jgi:hypothetical protein
MATLLFCATALLAAAAAAPADGVLWTMTSSTESFWSLSLGPNNTLVAGTSGEFHCAATQADGATGVVLANVSGLCRVGGDAQYWGACGYNDPLMTVELFGPSGQVAKQVRPRVPSRATRALLCCSAVVSSGGVVLLHGTC